MADTDATYQGWKNHETWQAALHLGNDQWSYECARDIVLAGDPYGDTLRDFVEELIIPDDGANGWVDILRLDIMTGWLQAVDWREVAKSFLDE